MSFSFVVWAMSCYNNETFGLSGKTVGSFRRNVLTHLKRTLQSRGYTVEERRSENLLSVSKGKIKNQFYVFGGKDEGSQDLIQGVTLAGMLFDEVALMPESFVNQAVARCSVEGSKLWFNCNPEGPYHWFKLNWIDKVKEKNALYIHFDMDDNLSLSEKIKARYRNMFSGVFFKRFILGLWVLAQGIIYDMFSEEKHIVDKLPEGHRTYYLTVDYGTVNPCVFLLFALIKNKLFLIDEYYYDSRTVGRQKTDAEYSKDLQEFIKGRYPQEIIIDPSAASFILQLRNDGVSGVRQANNAVLDGIRAVASALSQGFLYLLRGKCPNTEKEFHSYVWDEKAQEHGEDRPMKQSDHAMDGIRYLIYTIFRHAVNSAINLRGI
jgi:PBSX family phage terminase large subunit